MPCRDPGWDEDISRRRREAEEKVQDLTAQLCMALQFVEEEGLLTAKNVGLKNVKWWERHKEADRKRKAAERRKAKRDRERKLARKRGLAKLTPKERKALGV